MERVTKNLSAAIATMRAACDDAERRAKESNAYAVQQVLHALSWGMANASSSIECAMAAVEDDHDRQQVERAQRHGQRRVASAEPRAGRLVSEAKKGGV